MEIRNQTPVDHWVATASRHEGSWISQGWSLLPAFAAREVPVLDAGSIHIAYRPAPDSASDPVVDRFNVGLVSGRLPGDAKKFRCAGDASFRFDDADQLGWFASREHDMFEPVDPSVPISLFFRDFRRELQRLSLGRSDIQRLNDHTWRVELHPSICQRLNPWFHVQQKPYAALRSILLDAEHLAELLRNIETVLDLEELGHAVHVDGPLIYRTLYDIRRKLVLALRTEAVLRNNPGFTFDARHDDLLQLEPTQTERLIAHTGEHASLYQNALQLSMKVSEELSSFKPR